MFACAVERQILGELDSVAGRTADSFPDNSGADFEFDWAPGAAAEQCFPGHVECTVDCSDARCVLEQRYQTQQDDHFEPLVRWFELRQWKSRPRAPRPTKEAGISMASSTSSAD